MGIAAQLKRWWGPLVYAAAWALMFTAQHAGLQHETVTIAGPGGKPCGGTLWHTRAFPKAVMLIGHGVSSNQGMMAGLGKAYADAGYAALTLDFWGHGTSRERFDWKSNPGQLEAWCDWAAATYPGLPVAYLGHSMGGFAGAEAFTAKPTVNAFVSLGALPRSFPPVKTLVALGRFEELFSPETAQNNANGKAEVLVSPYSDHALEPLDPILIQGILAWTDSALALPSGADYSWMRWVFTLLATVLGCAGAFGTATQLAAYAAAAPRESSPAQSARSWSVNPYRIVGRAFGSRGHGAPPMAASLPRTIASALIFAAVLVALLASLLNTGVFTGSPLHPARCLGWAVLTCLFFGPLLLDAYALERLPLRSTRQRFLIAALTRGVPLLLIATAMQLAGHGTAFGGMMIGILAFVATMLSIVYALATRAAGDYIAGALASTILFAWVIAFWFPLFW